MPEGDGVAVTLSLFRGVERYVDAVDEGEDEFADLERVEGGPLLVKLLDEVG